MSESAYRLVREPRPAALAPVLDPAQQQVVGHDTGRLLVLAGPGTGKTTTLVESVVARVDCGVPVEHILMLTFSRRAAQELRDRVAGRLDRTIGEPVARTLHSYAFGVLRMANLSRGLPPPRLLAAAEQDVVIRELLPGRRVEWPPALRPALATRGFAHELRDLLMRAVERGLDGPSLVELGHRRRRPDWVAAGQFLTEYHEVTALQDPGGYDPAELVRAALRAFRDDPDLLAAERARRRRIFVDEYQDTDPAQAELLAVLAAGADELVLVGDPDQSIYAFRGADPVAMAAIPDVFGPTPTVALTTCRRFGSDLVAATRRVAQRLPGPAAHRGLQPAPGLPAGGVRTAVFRSASEEATYLAATLRRAHLDGTPWSSMAVVVRATARTVPTLHRALVTAGVPVALRGEEIPLANQPAVAALLHAVACCTAAARAGDTGAAGYTETDAEQLLLGPIGGIDVIYLRRLRRALSLASEGGDVTGGGAPRVGLAEVLRDPADAEALLSPALRRPTLRVARVLAAGVDAVEANGTPEDVLWAIWHASGLARVWAAASADGGSAGAAADRDLDAVVALFDAAARYTDRLPGESIAGFTAHLAGQEIPADTLRGPVRHVEGVSLLTAHAAKGLEWDVVCVAGVQEGSWPDLRRRGSLLGTETLVDVVALRDAPGVSVIAPQLAEERRLFYVAITRARRHLLVSAVADEDDQPSRFLDELDPGATERPTPAPLRGVHLPAFVAELRAAATDPTTTGASRWAAAGALARLATAEVPGADPADWWGLAPLSDPRPVVDPEVPVDVSPSRVESFLRCEVRTLLGDLGATDGDQLSASLGTLVHDVAAQAPPHATVADLEALLDAGWSALDFGARWYATNQRAKARRMLGRLAAWLADSAAQGRRLEGVEVPFDVELGAARMRGRVDRLERDAQGRLVVVDYKTGTSKPAKDELATLPQLGAYQLAVEHGGFGAGERSGGAMLVQLGEGKVGYDEQPQPPLADSDDPGWIDRAVDAVAARMHGAEFTARANEFCRNCDLRACCPLQPEGRQVTQ